MSEFFRFLEKEKEYSEQSSHLNINPLKEREKFWLKKKAGARSPVLRPFNSSISRKLFSEIGKLKDLQPGPGSYDPFIKPQPPAV
jgi:hypothetical protein